MTTSGFVLRPPFADRDIEIYKDIDVVQYLCLNIVFLALSYYDTLRVSVLERLDFRRESIIRKLFRDIKIPAQILHDILPRKCSSSSVFTRNAHPYELPIARTVQY